MATDTTVIIKKKNDYAKTFNTIKLIFINYYYWLVAIIVVGLLAAGYIMLLKPKYDFIMSNHEIQLQKDAYLKKTQYLANIEQLKAYFAQQVTAADQQKVSSLVGASDIKYNMMLELNYVVKKYDVLLDKLSVSEPVLNGEAAPLLNIKGISDKNELFGQVKVVRASFDLIGVNYQKLQSILAEIEDNIHLMDVTRLQYDPAVNAQKATVELQSYQF